MTLVKKKKFHHGWKRVLSKGDSKSWWLSIIDGLIIKVFRKDSNLDYKRGTSEV